MIPLISVITAFLTSSTSSKGVPLMISCWASGCSSWRATAFGSPRTAQLCSDLSDSTVIFFSTVTYLMSCRLEIILQSTEDHHTISILPSWRWAQVSLYRPPAPLTILQLLKTIFHQLVPLKNTRTWYGFICIYLLMYLGWEPFGSVHGLLKDNINTGVHARARGADVSRRYVTIARDGKRGYRVHVTSLTGSAQRILEVWRKWVELRLDTGRDSWLSLARGGLGQVSHEMGGGGGGGRWKCRNRKIVRLSPYVEKPLNSKVIKSFVPELRSQKCFSCFEIPMFYVIYIYMNIICPFHTWPYLFM